MTPHDGPERLNDAADDAVQPEYPDVTVEWNWQAPDDYDRVIGTRGDWMPHEAPALWVYYSGSGEFGEHWPPPVGWKIKYVDGRVGEQARNASLVEVLRLIPRNYWGWAIDQHQGLRVFLQNKVQWEIGRVGDSGGAASSDKGETTAKQIGGAAMDLFRLAREFAEAQDFQQRNQPPPYFNVTSTLGSIATSSGGGFTLSSASGNVLTDNGRALLEMMEISGVYRHNGADWPCCPICDATAPRTHGHGKVVRSGLWKDKVGDPCPLGVALGRNEVVDTVTLREGRPLRDPLPDDPPPSDAPEVPVDQTFYLSEQEKMERVLAVANLDIVRPTGHNHEWKIVVHPDDQNIDTFHSVGATLDAALLNVLGQLRAPGYPLG